MRSACVSFCRLFKVALTLLTALLTREFIDFGSLRHSKTVILARNMGIFPPQTHLCRRPPHIWGIEVKCCQESRRADILRPLSERTRSGIIRVEDDCSASPGPLTGHAYRVSHKAPQVTRFLQISEVKTRYFACLARDLGPTSSRADRAARNARALAPRPSPGSQNTTASGSGRCVAADRFGDYQLSRTQRTARFSERPAFRSWGISKSHHSSCGCAACRHSPTTEANSGPDADCGRPRTRSGRPTRT